MSGSPSRSISRSSSDIPSPSSQRIVRDFPTLDLGVDPENPFIDVSDNTPSTQAASGTAARYRVLFFMFIPFSYTQITPFHSIPQPQMSV